MSESITLFLPRTKCENVRVVCSRIRLLYGVSVDVAAPDSASDSIPSPGQGTVMTTEEPCSSRDRETSRLILTIPEGNQEKLNCAKEYLLAACSDSSCRCERRYQYASDVFQQLIPMRDEVERETSAMVKFEPQDSLVVVSGLERNVLAAIKYLDAKAQDIVVAKSKGLQDTAATVGAAAVSREVFRQCRGHLESEDSSYDSDYENVDPTTPSQESIPLHVLHDDVSRTVSDTLAAEFAEYVTTEEDRGVGGQQAPVGALRDLGSILSDPNYTSRVEFALKLGYTESQVQIALQKLGAQPSQNELLAELIKLGATCPAPSSVTEAHSKPKDSSEEGDRAPESTADVQRPDSFDSSNLRHIVIDGSNVAMSHGNKECFSCRGIKLCVDWFKARGHQNITVFVPRWRKEVSRPDAPIKDQEILAQLEKERLLVFTPSRHVGGRRMVCYDDRYVLRLAADTDGIVVSNDNYKDLANESPEFKKVVEDRLLMYSFVNDRFMPPEDPLGRHGPSLDNFLRKTPARSMEPLPPPCPYSKKCTYGNKCKYYHPERGNQPQKSVTERLAEQAKIPLQEVKSRGLKSRESSPGDKLKPSSVPTSGNKVKKQPLVRTKSLIPSVGRSDIALDKGNMVERTKSDSSSAGRCQDDDALLQHEQAPFQASCTFSPTGASWTIPHLSTTAVVPAPLPSSTTVVSSWAALSSTLPPNIPGPCAEMFLEPESGGHLFVAKRLSDPDSKQQSKGYSVATTVHQSSATQETGSGNLHRKLQRQLSLNPAYDPRLLHLGSYSGHQMLSPQQERCSLLQQQPDRGNLEQGKSSQESLQTVHRALGRGQPLHEPLARIASDGRVPNPLQAIPHVWEGTEHQTVTRIASAPDANLQWPPLSRLQHLNSTSDTRLNLYPDFQRGAAGLQPSSMGVRYSEGQQHQWMSQSHGLENPRPMSPVGLPIITPSSTSWQEHMTSSGISRTTSQVIGQPVRPSSVPPHGMQLGGLSLPARPQTPETPADARYKLEYHLSSIFPKEQVHAAMEMYPQETNPQKICAAILTMFPPKG